MRVSVLRRLIAASVIVYTIAGVWVFSSTHQTDSNFVIPTLAVLGNIWVSPTAIPDTSVVVAHEDTALSLNVQPVSAEVNPAVSSPQAVVAVATTYTAPTEIIASTVETITQQPQPIIAHNSETVTVLDTTYQTTTENLQSAAAPEITIVTGASNPPPNAVTPVFEGGGRMLVNTNAPVIAVDNVCSLIEAIENANADSAVHSDCPAGLGTDTIRLVPDSVHTLTIVHNTTDGANGLPSITSPIIIEGDGATIERYEASLEPPPLFYRLFHIAVTGSLTLNNITLRRGRIDGGYGAGIYNAGSLTLNNATVKENHFYDEAIGYGTGIYNTGTLTLNSSTVTENRATHGSDGVGIYNTGTLTLNSSTISHNRIYEEGTGDGIYNTGILTVANSTITSNVGGIHSTGSTTIMNTHISRNGGGFSNRGTATISDSVFERNTVRGSGGAIHNSGTLAITNTTFTSNGARFNGGGILNGRNASLTIRDSLLQSNSTYLDDGGALYSSGILHIENTTIDGSDGFGGGNIVVYGETSIVNSHITNNQSRGDVKGAAIEIGGTANVTLSQVTISNNSYFYGAAVNYSGTGLLTIENSIVSSNRARLDSAAIYVGYGGNVVITNTTIYDNSSERGASRALYVLSGTAAIEFSTIVQNGIDAIMVDGSSIVSVHNTIIVDGNCIGTNINATGINFTTTNCATYDHAFVTVTAEQLDLQPLADNGGAVETVMPGANSVALNAATCTLSDGTLLTVDARGEARPQGNGCEAGAVEVAFSCADCVDIQAPVTTIILTPAEPDGWNGWYITPVVVSLTAEDNPSGSGVATIEWSIDGGQTWQLFTDARMLSSTGETTVLARATDNAGNVEAPPVANVIRVDTIAPTIDITTDRTSYTRLDDVLISISAADTGSGVASVSAEFNGLAMTDGSIVNLSEFATGVITYSATVTDNAGWTATDTGQIEIVVTLDRLLALVDYLWEQGFITNQGIYNSLRQKIEGAIDAEERGQPHVVLNKLTALLHETQAQAGQHIAAEAAQLLEQDVMVVMLDYDDATAISSANEMLNPLLLTPMPHVEIVTTEITEITPIVTETVADVSATPEPTATTIPTNEPTLEVTDVPTAEPTAIATPE